MLGLRELYARSRRWPVRVRIAIVSATLTAVILIGFAAVVGRLVANRIEGDFHDDLQSRANELAAQMATQHSFRSSMPLSDDAAFRIVSADGVGPAGQRGFGVPRPGAIVRVGSFDVASAEIPTQGSLLESGSVTGRLYVQYARPHAVVGETIGGLWLFLGGGVAIGTLLAGLAGMAVASRAMRPIAALTAAARDIAATRDPSRRVPQPESEDEVAELAQTLDEMLRQLDAARADTEGAMERQREFVADASHELRTPLTSILANLELLDAALAEESDEDQRAAVGSALRSSKRMNRLVGDLLLLARADAGRLGRKVECDLAAITREALEEVIPVADGHPFSARIAETAPVCGNPDELHRMVLNLLENAIRHTPPGTRVQVELAAEEGAAKLIVTDDGPGLPPGMEMQVFDRFVRSEGPADRASRNGKGTGLGLSIVRAVVVGHGGEVAAKSPGGGSGTQFTISMPLARA